MEPFCNPIDHKNFGPLQGLPQKFFHLYKNDIYKTHDLGSFRKFSAQLIVLCEADAKMNAEVYIEVLEEVNKDDWLFNLYLEMYELLWGTL